MKVIFTLTLALFATLASSQVFLPFRNCDPEDTFQFGVIEFERYPTLNDPNINDVFIVGHFPLPFIFGRIDYSLFLKGNKITGGTSTEHAGETWRYNSAQSVFQLPMITKEGEYQLLVKVITKDGEQIGCAGLTFSV